MFWLLVCFNQSLVQAASGVPEPGHLGSRKNGFQPQKSCPQTLMLTSYVTLEKVSLPRVFVKRVISPASQLNRELTEVVKVKCPAPFSWVSGQRVPRQPGPLFCLEAASRTSDKGPVCLSG